MWELNSDGCMEREGRSWKMLFLPHSSVWKSEISTLLSPPPRQPTVSCDVHIGDMMHLRLSAQPGLLVVHLGGGARNM